MGATPTAEQYKAFAAEVRQAEQEAKAAQQKYLDMNEKLQSMAGALASPAAPAYTGPTPN